MSNCQVIMQTLVHAHSILILYSYWTVVGEGKLVLRTEVTFSDSVGPVSEEASYAGCYGDSDRQN